MDKVKIAGHWKDISTMYIKAAGKWKEVRYTLLKQGGKWINTSTLPWVYNITVVVKNTADVAKITSIDVGGNVIRTVTGKEVNFKSKRLTHAQIVIGDLSGDSVLAVRGAVANMKKMMYAWDKITTPPDLSNLDISRSISMEAMMRGWKAITTPPDLSSFDTSKVLSMNTMMYAWNKVTTPPDLSSFDTSLVVDMGYMMSGWGALTTPWGLGTGVEDFNIESLTLAKGMFEGTKVSTALYDAILTKWSAQNFKPNVTLGMGTAKYSNTSAIIACRKKLTDAGWQITDGGHA